jgi:hypothetical protein
VCPIDNKSESKTNSSVLLLEEIKVVRPLGTSLSHLQCCAMKRG